MNRQHSALPRWFWPALTAVTLLALALYGRALQFGFFNDDPSGHFALMDQMRLWQYLYDVGWHGYYRPMSSIMLELPYTLTGQFSRAAYHGLILLLHGSNIFLLGLLAARLSRPLVGLAAAAIFAVVPFNYEAVAYVAAIVHPLSTLFTLAALLSYLRAARSPRPGRWHGLTTIALILGLLSHENGLAIVPLLLVLEWLWFDRNWRRVIPYAIAPVVFAVIWLLVPKSGEAVSPSLAAAWQNGAVFWQTAVFPLLPLIPLNASQITAVFALFIAAAALLGGLAWRNGAARLWLFALAWIAATSAPAIIFLSPGYVLGGPRLTYLPSLGVALLWAILFQRRSAETAEKTKIGVEALAGTSLAAPAKASTPELNNNLRHLQNLRVSSFLSAILATAVLAAIILPPIPFITCQLDFYATTTQIVDGMAQATRASDQRPLRFVNIPIYFSSSPDHPDGCPNPYPWTPQGAVVIPGYANAADFVRANGGSAPSAHTVTVPEYAPGWQTHGPERPLATLRPELAATRTLVFDLSSLTFFDLSAAWDLNHQPPPQRLANFAALLELVGATTDHNPTTYTITADLTWQVLATPDQPVTAFVHLYDASGALVVQHDAPPAQGFVPFTHWQPADAIHDRHTIQLDGPLPPGRYTLAAGLYWSTSGERLPGYDNGTPLLNNVYSIATLNVE